MTLEQDGRPIGFAYYAPAAMTDRTWYLYWIAVAKTIQARGLGSRLLHWAEDEIAVLSGRAASDRDLRRSPTTSRPAGSTPSTATTSPADSPTTTPTATTWSSSASASRSSPAPHDANPQPPRRPRPPHSSPRSATSAGPGARGRGARTATRSRRRSSSSIAPRASAPRRASGGARPRTSRVALFRLRINLALEVRCPSRRPMSHRASSGSRAATAAGSSSAPSTTTSPRSSPRPSTSSRRTRSTPSRRPRVLGCTPTQLTRLLKVEPRALRLVNDQRREIGLHRLQ